MSTAPKKQNLVITCIIATPVEQVWQAWLDAQLVVRWWGPIGFTSPLAKMDFREGGTSHVCMSLPEFGDQYSTLHYKEIVPLQRIDYIHNLANKDGKNIDPTPAGMSPRFPQDQPHSVAFKDLGNGKIELSVTE